MNWLKLLLASRGVWTGFGVFVGSIMEALGAAPEVIENWTGLIAALALFVLNTVLRAARGDPTSHAAVMDLMEGQRRTIDALQEMRGVRR